MAGSGEISSWLNASLARYENMCSVSRTHGTKIQALCICLWVQSWGRSVDIINFLNSLTWTHWTGIPRRHFVLKTKVYGPWKAMPKVNPCPPQTHKNAHKYRKKNSWSSLRTRSPSTFYLIPLSSYSSQSSSVLDKELYI